jgi:hypothetical protein
MLLLPSLFPARRTAVPDFDSCTTFVLIVEGGLHHISAPADTRLPTLPSPQAMAGLLHFLTGETRRS